MNIIKCTLQAGGIGIWKCWFLWREKNGRAQKKSLGASMRTNKKLRPLGPGIKPQTHWWKASALTTAPSLLPLMSRMSLLWLLNEIKVATEGR